MTRKYFAFCAKSYIGAEIFDKMVAVANGELTKAEVLGHKEFGIYRIGDTF